MRDNALQRDPKHQNPVAGHSHSAAAESTAEIIPFTPPQASAKPAPDRAPDRARPVGRVDPQPRAPAHAPGQAHAPRTDKTEIDVTSDQGLGQIVRRLTDLLLLPVDEVSPQIHSLADHALAKLVDQLDVKSRFQLSERLSRCSEPPRLLIRRLVCDCEAVARPLLESPQKLSDLDLSRLAMKGGLAHRVLIARRPDLTTVTANFLVNRGEQPVVEALLDNRAVTLDMATLDLIIEHFAEDAELLSRLTGRADLHPRQGFQLFWQMDAEKRQKLLTRFAISRRQVREAASDLLALINRDLSLRSPATRASLRLAFGPIADRDASGNAATDGADATIDPSRLDHMLAVIKTRARIQRKTFAKILADPQGQPLAVLCKAVSIKKPDFICLARAMYKVHDPNCKLPAYLDAVAEVYDRLSWDGADMALRYWDDLVSRPQSAH